MIYLFYAFLVYLAYQFITKMVIPVYRATKQVKKGFREMKDRMQQQANTAKPGEWQSPNKKETNSKAPAGDYIDFEEVK